MKHRVLYLLPLLTLLVAPGFAAGSGWLKDYDQALKKAQKAGKPVLIEFSNSTTCETCAKLNKEVFFTSAFKGWARRNAILLHVDFPGERPLSDKQREANEKLKAQFKIEALPTIVVVGPEGGELGRTGYLEGGVEKFVDTVQPWIDAANGAGEWMTDFEKAKTLSKASGKPMLVDFTGSDWRGSWPSCSSSPSSSGRLPASTGIRRPSSTPTARCSASIGRCTSPTIPSSTRSTTSRQATRDSTRANRERAASRSGRRVTRPSGS
jgi:thioredoxin-related protein